MLTTLPPYMSEQGFVLFLYTRFKAKHCFMSGILCSEQQDNELDPKTGTGKGTTFKWWQPISQLQNDCQAELQLNSQYQYQKLS